MAELIRAPYGQKVDRGSIKVTEMLNSGNMSVAIVELDGTNDKVKNTICDVVYIVIEGNGYFKISDENGEDQMFEVGVGDLMHLPHGTIYQNSGKMKMLAIDTPEFDINQVVKV